MWQPLRNLAVLSIIGRILARVMLNHLATCLELRLAAKVTVWLLQRLWVYRHASISWEMSGALVNSAQSLLTSQKLSILSVGHPPIRLPAYLSVHQSSVHLCVSLYVALSFCPSTPLTLCLPVRPSVRLFTHLSACPFVCPSTHLSRCPLPHGADHIFEEEWIDMKWVGEWGREPQATHFVSMCKQRNGEQTTWKAKHNSKQPTPPQQQLDCSLS